MSPDSPAPQPPPANPSDPEFQRVWKMVEEIGLQERHFNELESRYRTMAAGWILGLFSAIGFVISETLHVGIDRYLLVAGIGVAGCAGLILLWILDLLVYHQLLDACFVEGLILEDRHRWLPPLRHNMMATQKGKGVLFRVVGFYLLPVVLFALVAGGGLAAWLWSEERLAAVASLGLGIAAAAVLAWTLRSRTENTAAIEARLVKARYRGLHSSPGSPATG